MPLSRALRSMLAAAAFVLVGTAGAQQVNITVTAAGAAPGVIGHGIAGMSAPAHPVITTPNDPAAGFSQVTSHGLALDPLADFMAAGASYSSRFAMPGGPPSQGSGRTPITRQRLMSLATAVPEPETYWLLLAGLCAIAFIALRRSGR